MKRSTLPWSGRRLATKGAAAALATATAATVAGMAATPAQSAIGVECPESVPVSELRADDPVDGLTVIKGTEPAAFTGKVLGVLDDGIAPGLDMIMVDLGSAGGDGADDRISDVGIWSGMSGSPVYAEDGRLIGAVSYGLALGPSTVAGVTPAADMHELIESGADPASQMARKVAVPQRIATRLVASGDASEREVESGLAQLKLPFGMSGLGQRRVNQVAGKLDIPGVKVTRMGTAAAGSLDAGDIVAGGNLATAISYGDVSYAGVGTATIVCGEEVVGFGHPMMWTGPTGLSLHPADAVYIQKDPTLSGFKVANIGAPVGTIDQDRMAGIAGAFGALPRTSTITSHVTGDAGERTGTTHVNLPEWVPDVALSHLLANEDRIFDGIGKGSGSVSWVIEGERQDGTAFEVTRSDVYADEYDLTWATAWDLYTALWRLESNRVENLTIDTVVTDSELSRDLVTAGIEGASIKQNGEWVPVGNRLMLVAGETAKFRIDVLTTGAGLSTVKVDLPVRKNLAGRQGYLSLVGGNSISSWAGGRNAPIDKVIDRIENAPHNDDVVANLQLWRERRSDRNVSLEERAPFGVPVNGDVSTRVRIIG